MINRPLPTPKDSLPAKSANGAAGSTNRQHPAGHLPKAPHARMPHQAARDSPENSGQRPSGPARNMPHGAHRTP